MKEMWGTASVINLKGGGELQWQNNVVIKIKQILHTMKHKPMIIKGSFSAWVQHETTPLLLSAPPCLGL